MVLGFLWVLRFPLTVQRTMEPIMPRLAILLGAFGIGMSGYSTHQLTLHHRPSTRVLQWVGGPSAVGSLAAQSRARASSDMLQSGDHQSFPPAVPKLPEAQLPGRSETSLAYTASSVPS
uniref:Zgc:193593 n=1 Tax=Denticeps clupeoides TaxID=299321 RepID=A0AAY4BMD4_9TELE